ncbi:MAG: prepilin [Thermodesulfovibrionaceae bacterium]
MKYQQKSKVSSYALPIVKACAHDALGYCSTLRISSDTQIDISTLQNCLSTMVPGGSLTITISGSVVCQPNGTVRDGVIRGSLQGVTEYDARCSFEENGILCTVVAI